MRASDGCRPKKPSTSNAPSSVPGRRSPGAARGRVVGVSEGRRQRQPVGGPAQDDEHEPCIGLCVGERQARQGGGDRGCGERRAVRVGWSSSSPLEIRGGQQQGEPLGRALGAPHGSAGMVRERRAQDVLAQRQRVDARAGEVADGRGPFDLSIASAPQSSAVSASPQASRAATRPVPWPRARRTVCGCRPAAGRGPQRRDEKVVGLLSCRLKPQASCACTRAAWTLGRSPPLSRNVSAMRRRGPPADRRHRSAYQLGGEVTCGCRVVGQVGEDRVGLLQTALVVALPEHVPRAGSWTLSRKTNSPGAPARRRRRAHHQPVRRGADRDVPLIVAGSTPASAVPGSRVPGFRGRGCGSARRRAIVDPGPMDWTLSR